MVYEKYEQQDGTHDRTTDVRFRHGSLTNRMKRLELQGKVITLLNQLWGENCLKSSPRRTVEVNWEDNGMEVTAGELRAPTFDFMNETKFRQQVQQLLKSQIQREQWLKNIIYQKFVTEWIKEPFTPWYLKRHASCNFK